MANQEEIDKVLTLATGKTGAHLDKLKKDLSALGVVIKVEPWIELPDERESDVECPNCRGYKEIPHYKEFRGKITTGDMYSDGRAGALQGEYTHSTICGRCKGRGRIRPTEVKDSDTCPYCTNGQNFNHSSRNQILVPCTRCNGTNKLKPKLIRGSFMDMVSYDMTIPLLEDVAIEPLTGGQNA